jgi:hypothetical protein
LDKLRELLDKLYEQTVVPVRRKIFGNNNENIDLLFDNFYRLSNEQRTAVLVGVGATAVITVFLVLVTYFTALANLESQLSKSFDAVHELRRQGQQYRSVEAQFNMMKQQVDRKVKTLRAKPFFEEVAKKHSVTMTGLNDVKSPVEGSEELAKSFETLQVDMRLTKISLPRLLKFLSEVERAEKYLVVEDLVIRGRYGTKLYFDAQAKFKGISSL